MANQNKKNIIWIVSYPKSGNTWFRILLSNILSGSEEPVNINELHPSPIASTRSIFEEYVGLQSSELTNIEIELLRPKVYRLLAQNSNSNLFLKVHDAWRRNTDENPIFPSDITKAVIYIVRNPFDVAKSNANHNGVTLCKSVAKLNNNSASISKTQSKSKYQLEQILLSWSKHVESWVDHSRLPVHVLRYEDLSSNPNLIFKNALDFLGLTYDDRQVSLAVRNSDFEVVSRQEREFGFKEKSQNSEKFFMHGQASDLHQLVDNPYYNMLKEHHSSIMARFGYYI